MGETGEVAIRLEYGQPPKPRSVIDWLLWVFAAAAAFVLYVWCALSPKALIAFDTTGLDPQDTIDVPLPVDSAGTVASCLGPPGWIVAGGTFVLALVIGLAVRAFPWWARALITASPVIVVLSLFPGWQIRDELAAIFLGTYVIEAPLAATAGLAAPWIARWIVTVITEQEGLPA